MTLYIGDKPVGLMKVVKDTEYINKTKFGASIDNILGSVNESGVYTPARELFTIDLSGIKEFKATSWLVDGQYVYTHGIKYRFYGLANLRGTVDLSSLEEAMTTNSLEGAFCYTGISEVILPKNGKDNIYMPNSFQNCPLLKRVVYNQTVFGDNITLTAAFLGCKNLEEIIGFENITKINKSTGGLFQRCEKLQYLDTSGLQEISASCDNMLSYCTALVRLDFPSLISVIPKAFATASYLSMLQGCTALTEIHFRADMQATIEALNQYSNKWGATNATIYFDLMGTIIVNGVSYARNELNSIRVDRTKTHVAWADESGNIIYTDATAEPAVGTVVYSDAGTTQVGTVEGVA